VIRDLDRPLDPIDEAEAPRPTLPVEPSFLDEDSRADADAEDELAALGEIPGTVVGLIGAIAGRAKEGRVPLATVEAALGAFPASDELATPDIALVLAELGSRGIEVDDGVSETELLAEPPAPVVEVAGDPGVMLDAFGQWRRDAMRHSVLSREQEIELTTRYMLYSRTALAIRDAEDRLAERIEEAAAGIRSAQEIAELLAAQKGKRAAKAAEEAKLDVKARERERRELQGELAKLFREREVAEAIAKRAEETFLGFNYRLVYAVANRKYKLSGRKGDLMDLIQQGNLGMVDAFKKFDPTRGFKFSTFATWHIQEKISAYLYEQTGSLRVPSHRWRDARKINKFREQFVLANGRQPTLEEIGEELGKTGKKISEILAAEQLTRVGSLDKPVTDEQDSASLGDLIADQAALSPEQEAIRGALKVLFKGAFAELLDARERRVLQLRFGTYDNIQHTLDWIGRRMRVTRERVRQIQERAQEKLRAAPEFRALIRAELGEAGLRRLTESTERRLPYEDVTD
jgi:RNA polymerase sigma factor (sigma-70 family)